VPSGTTDFERNAVEEATLAAASAEKPCVLWKRSNCRPVSS
jgi:hypothetical protein